MRCELNPCQIVFTLDFAQTGIISLKYVFVRKSPVDSVIAEARYKHLITCPCVNSENSGKAVAVRHYCGVENTVCEEKLIPCDDRVSVISPNGISVSLRFILPGNIFDFFTYYF